MKDLAERLRTLAEAIDACEWELPITGSDDCLAAAELCSLLDDPAVLLAIKHPQRMRISELLHGGCHGTA